jgi:hypothetical protein
MGGAVRVRVDQDAAVGASDEEVGRAAVEAEDAAADAPAPRRLPRGRARVPESDARVPGACEEAGSAPAGGRVERQDRFDSGFVRAKDRHRVRAVALAGGGA